MTEAVNQEEDGWTFWSRVYSDPKLRTEMDENANAGGYSTVAEVLSAKTLERTRIVMDNLPKSCSEEEIRNLLEGDLGNPKVMRVTVAGRKGHRATVEFYVASDAAEAVKRFHGFRYRGCILGVWSSAGSPSPPETSHNYSSDGDCCKEEGGVEEAFSYAEDGSGDHRNTDSLENKNPLHGTIGQNPLGLLKPEEPLLDTTTDENEECGGRCNHPQFLSELEEYLREKGPLEFSDPRMRQFLDDRASPSVEHAYTIWPLGAFRSQRRLAMVGKYVCMKEDEALAINACNGINEPLVYTESWEPHAPSQIRTWFQMAIYFESLLQHFGPLWIHDVIVTYFLCSLAFEWQNLVNLKCLDESLHPFSTGLVRIGDTFYLVSDFQHRTEAAKAIRDGKCCSGAECT